MWGISVSVFLNRERVLFDGDNNKVKRDKMNFIINHCHQEIKEKKKKFRESKENCNTESTN